MVSEPLCEAQLPLGKCSVEVVTQPLIGAGNEAVNTKLDELTVNVVKTHTMS